MDTHNLLNIAQLCPSTSALGPGNRFAIWVQGCPFNCKGCIAQDWIPFRKATVMAAEELASSIIARKDIQGITVSGGEPMMQAGRLSTLLQLVKQFRPELNVIVFSGFKLNQLVWDEAKKLLTLTDLLVDGQYVKQQNDELGLRGSNNQKFHFLTDRLLPHQTEIIGHRSKLEFHLLNDGVLMAGIPPANFTW